MSTLRNPIVPSIEQYMSIGGRNEQQILASQLRVKQVRHSDLRKEWDKGNELVSSLLLGY